MSYAVLRQLLLKYAEIRIGVTISQFNNIPFLSSSVGHHKCFPELLFQGNTIIYITHSDTFTGIYIRYKQNQVSNTSYLRFSLSVGTRKQANSMFSRHPRSC